MLLIEAEIIREVSTQVYDRFAPYQFLVYWYELRKDYENLFGPLTHMDPEDYARATGSCADQIPFAEISLSDGPAVSCLSLTQKVVWDA